MTRWFFLVGAVGCGAPVEVPVAPSQASTVQGIYELRFEAEPQPFLAGDAGVLRVQVSHDEAAVAGADLAVDPWMPDMGHGLADPVQVQAQADGWHHADLTFSMPGYWELTLQVDGPPGADEVTIAYEVE